MRASLWLPLWRRVTAVVGCLGPVLVWLARDAFGTQCSGETTQREPLRSAGAALSSI